MIYDDKLTRALRVTKNTEMEPKRAGPTRQELADEAQVSLWTIDDARRIMSIPNLADLVLEGRVSAGWALRIVRDPRGRRKYDKNSLILELLIERQSEQCSVCERPLSLKDAELDHIRPVSLGGKTEADNVQALHALCNKQKRDKITISSYCPC